MDDNESTDDHRDYYDEDCDESYPQERFERTFRRSRLESSDDGKTCFVKVKSIDGREVFAIGNKSPVFIKLAPDTDPPKEGQWVWVRLRAILERGTDLPRLDRRDNVMYRGEPGPVRVVNDDWIDFNGQHVRITGTVDWLSRPVGNYSIAETCSSAAYEEKRWEIERSTVEWGVSTKTSRITITRVGKQYRMQPIITRGERGCDWRMIGECEDKHQYPIVGLKLVRSDALVGQLEQVSTVLDLELDFTIIRDNLRQSIKQKFCWYQLPEWLRQALIVNFPMCSCGRCRALKGNVCSLCSMEKFRAEREQKEKERGTDRKKVDLGAIRRRFATSEEFRRRW